MQILWFRTNRRDENTHVCHVLAIGTKVLFLKKRTRETFQDMSMPCVDWPRRELSHLQRHLHLTKTTATSVQDHRCPLSLHAEEPAFAAVATFPLHISCTSQRTARTLHRATSALSEMFPSIKRFWISATKQ